MSESLTGALTPSSPVRVTTKTPSSLQVKVEFARLGSLNVQVVPGSTEPTGVKDHRTLGLSSWASSTEPVSCTSEPSLVLTSAPAFTVGGVSRSGPPPPGPSTGVTQYLSPSMTRLASRNRDSTEPPRSLWVSGTWPTAVRARPISAAPW